MASKNTKSIKIHAQVQFSEFVMLEFMIDCGQGNQFISWLASTACLQFSQKHYPKGIYVPTLLQTKDELVPHPR